ncbi:MAG TPA: hypothetical protein VNA15_06355 [Candidatus Angelobacter sp.]|nr:hypothetical protein [Candidatus Angelobacter sp.]
MGLSVKPVTIRDSTYLRVPKDVAELIRVMASKICSVNFKIDEKECTLIYSFAKSVPDLTEEPSDPTLLLAE